MSNAVLDAGALIALERNDRSMWAALKAAVLAGDDVLVPTSALAQVWRGTAKQSRLGQALQHCVRASFDDRANQIGELCGRTHTSDVCDAHVALVAAALADVLYTSDPDDLIPLIAACRRRKPVVISC